MRPPLCLDTKSPDSTTDIVSANPPAARELLTASGRSLFAELPNLKPVSFECPLLLSPSGCGWWHRPGASDSQRKGPLGRIE
jgi:hypothetical protein